jgi:hypothetical protein
MFTQLTIARNCQVPFGHTAEKSPDYAWASRSRELISNGKQKFYVALTEETAIAGVDR